MSFDVAGGPSRSRETVKELVTLCSATSREPTGLRSSASPLPRFRRPSSFAATRNLKAQYAHYRDYFTDIHEIGTPNGLVEDVLVGTLGGIRVGYASVYGGPMASEVTHLFGALGTRLVVQIGCCGAIADGIGPGDLVLAEEAFCGDGASQYYTTGDDTVRPSPPAASVIESLRSRVPVPVHVGRVFTTAALFAEGRRELDDWHAMGFVAVDMETAATFAVAEHFGMERLALLFAFDNPRQSGHLLLNESDKADRRSLGNRCMNELALAIVRERLASA